MSVMDYFSATQMTLNFIVFVNFENNNIQIGRLSTIIMIVSSI